MNIHYAEKMLSDLNGGPPAGWPSLSRMGELRIRIGSWIKSMENERTKWSKDVTDAALTKQVQVERFVSKMAEKFAAGFLSKQAKEEALVYAKNCLDENEAKHCHLEIPICWEEAFKRLEMVRKEQKELLKSIRQQEIKDLQVKIGEQVELHEAKEAKAEAKAEELEQVELDEAKEQVEVEEEAKAEAEPEAKAEIKAEESGNKPDWRYDLLEETARKHVLKVVQSGLGICGKCRWRHGCYMCDEEKALRYFLGKQGYLGPAVWNC